jgi:hypothetical protein
LDEEKRVSKPSANVAAISDGEVRIKQATAVPQKKQWWRKESRAPMVTPELELAILEAVKQAEPGCEDFVGVVVAHETPKASRFQLSD